MEFGERQQDLAGLWASYSRYSIKLVRIINETITRTVNDTMNKKYSGNNRVVCCLFYLLSVDLKVPGSMWRKHMNGYFQAECRQPGTVEIVQADVPAKTGTVLSEAKPVRKKSYEKQLLAFTC